MRKIVWLLVSTVTLWAVTNAEVAQKSDAVTDGFISSTADMQMTLINAHGQQVLRALKSETLEGDDGDKSLMEFLSPADVKGTKMLTHEHLNRDDDQWMYLPALKRTKRIASRNKSGSFMGSEFSYEDVANASWEEYTYQDDLKEVRLEGVACYQGTRIPKDKNSGYTKQVTWIDKATLLVKKVDYYDRKQELLKTATFSDWKKIDGIYVMGKIHMKNHQNSKETILLWQNQTIKAGLSDSDFSKRVLKR
jgi:outer membrane lipoprotein-sorting protein